jgi:hypothetical protein
MRMRYAREQPLAPRGTGGPAAQARSIPRVATREVRRRRVQCPSRHDRAEL